MTKIFEDGSTPINEANLNKLVGGVAGKLGINVNYGLIRILGGEWVIYSPTDSNGLSSPSWNSGGNRVEVMLSGFTQLPVAFVTMDVGSAYLVKVQVLGSNLIGITFYDIATGALITSQDNNMFAMIFVIGV